MLTYKYIYMNTHPHARTYIYKSVLVVNSRRLPPRHLSIKYICTHIYRYIVHIYIYVYICTYLFDAQVCTHIHIYIYIYVHIYMYKHMYMYTCVHIYTCIHILYIHEKHIHTHKYIKLVFFGNPPTCRHGHSASCIYKYTHIHENTRAHICRNQYFFLYPTAAAIELIHVNIYMHIPANTCTHTHTYMGTSIYCGIHPPAAAAIQYRICTHLYTSITLPMHIRTRI